MSKERPWRPTKEERKARHEKLFPGMPLPPKGFGMLFPLEGLGEAGKSLYLTVPLPGVAYITDDIGIVILAPFPLPPLPLLQVKVKE